MASQFINSNLSSLRPATSSSNENQENIVKDIEKCGHISLKLKLSKDDETTSNYQSFWAMFYVINDEQPILELFTKEQQRIQHVNNQESFAKINLKTCHHITVPILFNDKENENEFVISLNDQLLQIFVDDKELLNEWVCCLRTKLSNLNILSPLDNIYSKEPIMNTLKKPIMPRNRPLPPLPDDQSNQQNSNQNTRSISNHHQINRRMERLLDNLNDRTIDRNTNLGARNNLIVLNRHTNLDPTTSSSNDYEHLSVSNRFNHSSNSQSSMNSSNQSTINQSFNNNYMMLNSLSRSLPQSNETTNRNSVLTLRESQVLRLQQEINNRGGVKLKIRRIDCLESIAFIDWLAHIYVAGWKQRLFPQLHNTFKIGDEIVFVNGFKVATAYDVNSLIKQTNEPIIEFIIRRTPYGKAFLIKRDYAGQELGIVRDRNKAEILYIEPNSPASKCGIPDQTKPVDQLRTTDINWTITEINSRPLSLFFKGDEIKTRLNAVGAEISILIQPLDLIKNIKKQLKSIKGYKDYIVQ